MIKSTSYQPVQYPKPSDFDSLYQITPAGLNNWIEISKIDSNVLAIMSETYEDISLLLPDVERIELFFAEANDLIQTNNFLKAQYQRYINETLKAIGSFKQYMNALADMTLEFENDADAANEVYKYLTEKTKDE